MVHTPLYKLEDGYYTAQFKLHDKVYAETTDFNITHNEQYEITDVIGLDVEIINDKGEREIYTSDWFSITKYK